jgi:hypothetical protein
MAAALGGGSGMGAFVEEDGDEGSLGFFNRPAAMVTAAGSSAPVGRGNQNLALYIAPLDIEAYEKLPTHPTYHQQLPPYFKGIVLYSPLVLSKQRNLPNSSPISISNSRVTLTLNSNSNSKGKTKNRYWDILPNPTTRVQLRHGALSPFATTHLRKYPA